MGRFRGFLYILFAVMLAVPAAAQAPKTFLPSTAQDDAARLYRRTVALLNETLPAFEEALKEQMADGECNEGVRSWLDLLQTVEGWPEDLRLTSMEKEARREADKEKHRRALEEMKKSLLEPAEGTTEPPKP